MTTMSQPQIVTDSITVEGQIDSLTFDTSSIIDSFSAGDVSIVETFKRMSHINFSQIMTSLGSEAVHIFLKIILSLVIYYVGRWLIERVVRIMNITFVRRNVDVSLRSFLRGLVSVILYLLLALTIVQLLGINTTSIVAMLASAGLALGMALSGTLQNFAGGAMVLFLKPYKVGDYVDVQGQSGYVREIMLFTTVLETYDGNRIFIPNGGISSSIIDNYSYAGLRRVVWRVSISYGDDIDAARKTILDMFKGDGRISKSPDNRAMRPSVVIMEMGESSVNIAARVWVKIDDYWPVFFKYNERIYKELPKCGVKFPFPQVDVHIKEK